jgi:hypothetical protein
MCDYDWSSGSFMFKQKQSRSIYEKKQKYLVRISKYSASCLHPNMEFYSPRFLCRLTALIKLLVAVKRQRVLYTETIEFASQP